MADTSGNLDPGSVTNETVWWYTRLLFGVALCFFLVNIGLGFLNASRTGPIPHWQIVTHLHAAALGWFTLSAIALALWVFTGRRAVSERYVKAVKAGSWLAILTVVAYVASHAIAFRQGGDFLHLLPIFGSLTVLLLWAITLSVVLQLRTLPTVSNVHVFVAGALLVVAIGGTMGVLIGLQLATGTGISDVGAHAPVMLFYILLLVSAIVEWTVQGSIDAEWSRLGLCQALAAVVGGLVPAITIPLGLDPLLPLMLLGLVVFFLLFLGRVGWKALSIGPFTAGIPAWTFFGTIWLVPVVLVFPAEIAIDPPEWFFPVVAHMAFLGMTSNVLFGLVSERTRESRRLHPWAEPGAMWLLNLGILTFVAVEIVIDARHGAFVMGLGALLGVSAILYRLLE